MLIEDDNVNEIELNWLEDGSRFGRKKIMWRNGFMHMPSIDWLCIMITRGLSARENVVYRTKCLFLIKFLNLEKDL